MNAFELADLAALVGVRGQHLATADSPTADRSLAAYWLASRCRLDRWGYGLRSLGTTAERRSLASQAACLVEEILVSEILARIVAAVAAAHDLRHEQAEMSPIGRNILNGHVDARRRAVALIATPHHAATAFAQSTLALERQCQRWSDLLMGYLSQHLDVDEFATSPARVHDFAYDARHHLQSAASTNVTLTMLLTGMRSSLARLSHDETPNADLNREIAAAVIGWFEPTLFDSLGLPGSELLARLRNVPNESLARLDQWRWPSAVAEAPSVARWRR